MGLQDAERAKMASLAHDLLYYGNSVEFLDGPFIDGLHKLVLCDIGEGAILAVPPQSAVLSEYTRVRQALQHTVGEAGISHIVETRKNIHLLKLLWIAHFTGPRSGACTLPVDAQVALQLLDVT